jgi:macrolide-specific efflux system membrane fusion protein
VAGMYASVLIPLHTAKNVLTLPIQVVQSAKESQGTVLVVNSKNRIEQRAVTLGLQTATQVEIISGLQENEMVVFGEQAQFQAGQLVSPKFVEPGGKD